MLRHGHHGADSQGGARRPRHSPSVRVTRVPRECLEALQGLRPLRWCMDPAGLSTDRPSPRSVSVGGGRANGASVSAGACSRALASGEGGR